MKITILTACLLAFLFTFSTPTFAATATVNLTTDQHDANPGDGVCAIAGGGCSLRAAVEEANFYGVINTIRFNLPQYSTITLTAGNGGEIRSNYPLVIIGPGAFYLTIDGGAGINRIFHVIDCKGCINAPSQQRLDIYDVTLTGGNGGGKWLGGGAILADVGATLELHRVRVYGNSVYGNSANNGSGGGVAFLSAGGLIKDSTISGNTANNCGGVYLNGTVFIVNSTISGNTANNSGGGLCNFSDTTLRNVTITNNTSRYTNDGTNSTTKGGGGILQAIGFTRSSSTLNLGNTIVAGNFGRDGYLNPTEIQFASGTITSAGGNLIGNSAGDSAYTGANAVAYHPTDIRDVNPMLGALEYASGFTPTQLLLAGSPAIDAGINSLAVYPYIYQTLALAYDQRGWGDFPRIRDGNGDGTATVDIGAIEFQPGQTYSTPTAAGQNVTVAPTSNLNLTFSNVTTAGNTTAIVLSQTQLPPLPSNFSLTSNSIMYDITTSAVYSGNITVTFNVPNVADATACSRLRILHYTNNAWDDSNNATPSYNSGTKVCTVSQTVTSLSPFVVAQINNTSHNISGSVSYGITLNGQPAKVVPGVTLNAGGSSSVSALTNSSGAYSLNNLNSGGNYTVTPSKTGGIGTPFSSVDASRVLQAIVGLVTLTPQQTVAADSDSSADLSTVDASNILKAIVGLPNAGTVGQWKFLPAQKTYSSLSTNLTGQNFEAVVVGDVDGDWAAPASAADEQANLFEQDSLSRLPEAENFLPVSVLQTTSNSFSTSSDSFSAAAAPVAVSLPTNASGATGTTVTIPITVGNTTGENITGFNFVLNFDSSVITPLAGNLAISRTGTLSQDFLCSVNTNVSGQLSVACAGDTALEGAGTLINLRFNVVGTSGATTALTLNTFRFNAGTPAATITNGQFRVLTTTAASVSVAGKVTARGRGISNAVVHLTSQNGEIQTARTNRFGYYTFRELAAGETYIFNVFSKRYQFDSKVINLTEDLSKVDFTAQ